MKDNQKLVFLFLLKQIILLADSGDTLRLDRPNSQIDEDFNAAIDRLKGIGVEVTTQPSSFADNYTYYGFTWQDMADCIARNKVFSVSGNKTSNNSIKNGIKSTDCNNFGAAL